ncbi:MAG TPA: hypothetical protein DCE41_29000 [Cytophagales bacterium]|nr:hypothetical protein [Cytophagales bacterium]HAP63706.1 hypothetical protein [Cytophagales bacterium]
MEKVFLVFLGLFLISILAEAWHSRKHGKGWYNKKDSRVSLALGVFGVLTRLALKGGSLAFWMLLYQWAPWEVPQVLWAWVVLFLANEFVYYWFHRWSHTVPWLWATHVSHHSSDYMNFTVATRTPFLNAIYHTLFWAPLPLLGFHPVMIFAVEQVSFFFAFFQHTQWIRKLPGLEWVLNTPSHHRVHHGKNPQYQDRNFGNVLIIWDRLFGTFTPEEEPPVYGVDGDFDRHSLKEVIFHEWSALWRKCRKRKEGSKAVKA